MKPLLLIGSQPRHLYFALRVVENWPSTDVIVMARERMIPELPVGTGMRDSKMFQHHFNLRQTVESEMFGAATVERIGERASIQVIGPNQLNSAPVAEMIRQMKSDVGVVFGTDLIKDPTLGALPLQTFNVHLGLSPWYRGSATLFWPFYFMEPQWAGVTVHRLTATVDGGDIAFQCTPNLRLGMGIHDVACHAVVQATNQLLRMLELVSDGKHLKLSRQKSTGRIFRVRDFRPVHLRVNYELFGDRMVDSWIYGDLLGTKPILVPLTHE